MFCPSADVVMIVPLQAADCDTAGGTNKNDPAFSPFEEASFLIAVT